jgi:hypothetical protein
MGNEHRTNDERITSANSHLAKAGDYGNDTPGSSLKFLLPLINLCFKIPAFAKWRNVIGHFKTTTTNGHSE